MQAFEQLHGQRMSEPRRWSIGAADGLVAAVLLALMVGWLGAGPLFDVDEGAFAEASREMLASGDWGHTTLNGADRFDKPILVYWLQAAALALIGPHEWAARLPSALCAWGWAMATWAFVQPRVVIPVLQFLKNMLHLRLCFHFRPLHSASAAAR